MLKIATWNVNSIRARIDVFSRWVQQANPDVIMLQETKCEDSFFPTMDITTMGYNYVIRGQKSYNGVAILSKIPLQEETNVLDEMEFGTDLEARYIEATFNIKEKCVRVASVYVPNGASLLAKEEKLEDSARFNYKLNFFKRLQHRANTITEYGDIFFMGGDYNVAHKEIDLHNPKSARGDVGFHDSERALLDELLHSGYTDCFRKFHPDAQEYSWWDYRTDGWGKNKGWRIDYMLASQSALPYVQNCDIDKETRSWVKTSDHVPVVIQVDI